MPNQNTGGSSGKGDPGERKYICNGRKTCQCNQDIRPIHILILNLMPLKEETELQLLRSLSKSPLQVDVTFMAVESHEAKNTSLSHLNKFYETFTDIKKVNLME